MDKQRLLYLDRMKAYAILLVVLGHVYLISLQEQDSIIYRYIASFHMHFFMFISGYVAYLPPPTGLDGQQTIRKKLLKRFLSYIFPAFSFSIFVYAICFLSGINTNETITGAWYLKLLALFTAIQFFLYRHHNILFELAIIIPIYILFIYLWKNEHILNNWLCYEHIVCFYPFYIMGYFFKKYDLMKQLMSHNFVFTISFLGYVFLLFTSFDNHALSLISERILRPTFAILFTTYLFLLREKKSSFIERKMEYVGQKTLDIYVFHGFLLTTFPFFNLCYIEELIQTGNSLLGLVLAIVVSLLILYMSIGIGIIIRNSDLLEKLMYGNFSTHNAEKYNKTQPSQ